MDVPKGRMSHTLICIIAFLGYFLFPFSLLFIPQTTALFQSSYASSLLAFFVYLPYCLIIWFFYQKKFNLLPLGEFNLKQFVIPCLLLIIFACINAYIGTGEQWALMTYQTNQLAVFLFLLTLFLVAPITEEVIFRGFLLNAAIGYGKTAQWLAVIISSLLFSAVHMQYHSVQTFIFIFIIGIILCLARIKTRSLLAPIVLHSLNNIVAVLFIAF